MKTIEIGGKEYEVLDARSTDSRDCTHARIGEGKPFDCQYSENSHGFCGFKFGSSWVYFRDCVTLGIQPLKLLPKAPVEFTCEVEEIEMSNRSPEFVWVKLRPDDTTKFDLEVGDTLRVEVTE